MAARAWPRWAAGAGGRGLRLVLDPWHPEGRRQLLHLGGAARRAGHRRAAAEHQLLELRPALVASILEDRHREALPGRIIPRHVDIW